MSPRMIICFQIRVFSKRRAREGRLHSLSSSHINCIFRTSTSSRSISPGRADLGWSQCFMNTRRGKCFLFTQDVNSWGIGRVRRWLHMQFTLQQTHTSATAQTRIRVPPIYVNRSPRWRARICSINETSPCDHANQSNNHMTRAPVKNSTC